MKDTERTLCEKYTSLRGEEFDVIESYIRRLDNIAKTENCDVFIDCPTMTGNSLIIVGEKKPPGGKSLYTKPLLGGFIKWENEPAVKRAYNSALPVTNLIAVSMPENRHVMQSAFPIIHKNKVLGILIYERLAPTFDREEDERPVMHARYLSDAEESLLLRQLDEAIFYITWNDRICFRNRAAKHLLRDIGYVDDPLNMHVSNFWYSYSELGERELTSRIAGYSLSGRYIYIGSERIKCVLLVRNISETEKAISERESIALSFSGYRHRVKNILQLVRGLYTSKAEKAHGELREAYEETAARLRSLAVGMTQKHSADGKTELRGMISEICTGIIENECSESCRVDLTVEGDNVFTSDENAAVLCEVVTELMHNSLKYAFQGREEGHVHISVTEKLLGTHIIFADDGIGFLPGDVKPESTGLQILAGIVHDRLSGEFTVESDSTGTRTTIEYIE